MAVWKNVASQKLIVYAYDTAASAPKTGDASNITCYLSLDGGSAQQTNDVNPTELDATNLKGLYAFDLTQGETNCDVLIASPVSSTSDVVIEPIVAYTMPAGAGNRPAVDVQAVSGDTTAADNQESFFDGTGYAGTGNTIPTVTDVTNGVTLADDAITSDKFDESTAFPQTSADVAAMVL